MEDYVTYEQAVKLKELGFDGFDDKWDCDYWYYCSYDNPNEPIFERREITDSYDVEKSWYAPTLALAQKWLREVKQVYLFVTMEDSHYYWYIGKEFQIGSCESYEQSLSAGINRAIDLLTIKQNKE